MIQNTLNLNLAIEHKSHFSHKMVSQFSALLTTSSFSSTTAYDFGVSMKSMEGKDGGLWVKGEGVEVDLSGYLYINLNL